MVKTFANSSVTLTATFKNSAGTLTDPTAVTFDYAIGTRGEQISVTPVNTSTGVYTATFTPDRSGIVYGVFKGTGALVKAIPVQISIYPDQFPVGSVRSTACVALP